MASLLPPQPREPTEKIFPLKLLLATWWDPEQEWLAFQYCWREDCSLLPGSQASMDVKESLPTPLRLSFLLKLLYHNLPVDYAYKQWGCSPSVLPPSPRYKTHSLHTLVVQGPEGTRVLSSHVWSSDMVITLEIGFLLCLAIEKQHASSLSILLQELCKEIQSKWVKAIIR